jgi:hypothetical protein
MVSSHESYDDDFYVALLFGMYCLYKAAEMIWKILIVILVLDFIKRCIQYGGQEARWWMGKVRVVSDKDISKSITKEQLHTMSNMLMVIMGQIDLGDKEKAKDYVRKLTDYLASHAEN